MDKIWYVEINHRPEGPFSVAELKVDYRLTPDTRVWKKGFTKWLPIRNVPELCKQLFVENKPSSIDDFTEDSSFKSIGSDQLIMEANIEPPYLFWILVILTIFTYLFFHLRWQ